jgi:hypothetical protein
LGNEDLFHNTEKGIFKGFSKDKHGKDISIVLQDVLHVPWLAVNLLSITKFITKQGVQFTSNNRNLFLSIHGTQIKLDKEIQHGTGRLFAIDIKPLSCEAAYLILDFDKFHSIFGHPHNVTLKETSQRIRPNKLEGLTELEGISDSEYGADQETRISVFGWNLYFCGALIS